MEIEFSFPKMTILLHINLKIFILSSLYFYYNDDEKFIVVDDDDDK